eukprot:g1273.t1
MWLSYEDMLTIWNANADDNPFPLGFRQFEQYRAICTLFFEKMVQTYRQARAHDGYLQLREVLAHWKKHENLREQDDLQQHDDPAHLQEVGLQPHKKSKKLVVATTNLDQLASAVFGGVATEVVPMHGNIDRTRFHGYRVRDVRACDRKVLGPFAFSGSSVSAVRSAAADSCDAEASTALEMKQIEEEASFHNEYRNLPVVAKPEVLHFSESYNPPFTNLFGLLHAGDLFGGAAAEDGAAAAVDHAAQEAAARALKPGSAFGEKLLAAWNEATARDDGDTDEAEGAGRPQFHCPVKEYALRVQ